MATYRIWSAPQKEKEEHLPYLFLVISTPIAAEGVVNRLPAAERELVRFVHSSGVAEGKRDLEERIVRGLLANAGEFDLHARSWRDQIASATWRVISAQRADKLLREMLFERVFAVRTRNFTQAFRNAELDMHFSLADDLTPLDDVLEILAREDSQGVVGRSMRAII